MKRIAAVLYSEPVIFLGVIQGVLTALAAESVITGWIPVVSLAAIVPMQRYFVTPDKAE